MENKEYYDMLKKKIEERVELQSLYYSKIELKDKLEEEIETLGKKIGDIDCNIIVLTPHKKIIIGGKD